MIPEEHVERAPLEVWKCVRADPYESVADIAYFSEQIRGTVRFHAIWRSLQTVSAMLWTT